MSINTSLVLQSLPDCEAPRLVPVKKEENPADNPNYFRVVQTRLQFISEDFKEGSAIGHPRNNPHDLPVRYYPGERLREVFSFRKDGLEFFDLSKETDFLCALDELAPAIVQMKYQYNIFHEKPLGALPLKVFDSFRKLMTLWGKENGIPGVFVPFQVLYRTTEPFVNASPPLHLAHVDHPEEFFQNPPKEVKKIFMDAAKCVFGEDMTEAEYDKLKCHDPINFWVPVHKDNPASSTLAFRLNSLANQKDLKHNTRTFFFVPEIPTLAPLYDPDATWILQEDSMQGSGALFGSATITHSAAPISVEGGEQHRKSFEFRGLFFSR